MEQQQPHQPNQPWGTPSKPHPAGSKRGLLLMCGVLGISALLGGLFGPSRTTSAATANDVQDSAKSFTSVLATVEANYADPVDADKAIYDGAIPGMLHSLDPHSNF